MKIYKAKKDTTLNLYRKKTFKKNEILNENTYTKNFPDHFIQIGEYDNNYNPIYYAHIVQDDFINGMLKDGN